MATAKPKLDSTQAASLLATVRDALKHEQTGISILTWPATPLGPLWAEVKNTHIISLNWGKPPPHVVSGRDETLATLHKFLNDYFNNPLHHFDWSIFNPKGTTFQRKVWQALCEIPPGTTTTYGTLAKKLGSSPRAVGGAVGSNPIPILIPCHRVMGANGAMTGFSAPGGLKTKRWLLRHEGITCP